MADSPLTHHPLRSAAIRLLAIPFLVYLAWLLEVFLLAGNNRLFAHPDLAGVALYTVAGCVITGMVIPVLCIRKAFLIGAVNMFQIGFRTLRRTFLACSVTAAAGFGFLLFANPFGADRIAFASAFLLVLPTAAASVMVCWVLAGTHVQAFVREGGAPLSIATGLVTTSLLFAAAMLAAALPSLHEDTVFWPVIFGIIIAFVFFALRDVYATVIIAAFSGVLLGHGTVSPGILRELPPAIYILSLLPVATLIVIHIWLFRNYATIIVPAAR